MLVCERLCTICVMSVISTLREVLSLSGALLSSSKVDRNHNHWKSMSRADTDLRIFAIKFTADSTRLWFLCVKTTYLDVHMQLQKCRWKFVAHFITTWSLLVVSTHVSPPEPN